jgi:hypothetical protein
VETARVSLSERGVIRPLTALAGEDIEEGAGNDDLDSTDSPSVRRCGSPLTR